MSSVERNDWSRFAAQCIAAGAALMLLGVILGAFGAHALQSQLTPQRLASYQTGVHYQFLHALGLLVIGLLAHATAPARKLRIAAVLMLAGVVLFSGSIYAMSFGAPRWLGVITPVGGVSMMLAWAAITAHALALARSGRGQG